ncbi:nuclear transport factor 2 family protein [Arthrobacter sp. D3-16]
MVERLPQQATAVTSIEQVMAEFAYRLDHCAGRGISELFTPEGRYSIDQHDLVGQEVIRAAYLARENLGPRTVRHLFLNNRVQFLSESECRQQSVMLLYGGDGDPILPVTLPLAISDVHDHLVNTENGWRFLSRDVRVVFRGDAKIVSPHAAVNNERNSQT